MNGKIMDEKVRQICLYHNAIVYNTHHERPYLMKKYLEIEFFNNKIIKLDIESNADITDCDYLIVMDKGKYVKSYFEHEFSK